MATTRSATVLLDRGDLPSLAAAVIQSDPTSLILWHMREDDPGARRREAFVARHAELLGAREVVVVDPWDGTAAGVARADDPGLWQTMELLQATMTARRRGCVRVVWPVQVGPDAAAVGTHVDRATAVADLVSLSPTPAGPSAGIGKLVGPIRSMRADVAIDLPLVDLADDQIVDLVDDAGAALDLFWPCDLAGARPCGACTSCVRWHGAFEARGVPGPWAATV